MSLTIERGTPTPAWRFWGGDRFRLNPNGPVLEVISVHREVMLRGKPWKLEFVNPAEGPDAPIRRRTLDGPDHLLIAEEVTR